MLDYVALIVAIAAVIVSAVVPFVSVWMAQRLVSRHSLRQSARDAFLRVLSDIQAYRVAFLEHYMNVERKSPDDRNSAANLQEKVANLNGNCLYLELLFDRQAHPLGSRMRQLVRQR